MNYEYATYEYCTDDIFTDDDSEISVFLQEDIKSIK